MASHAEEYIITGTPRSSITGSRSLVPGPRSPVPGPRSSVPGPLFRPSPNFSILKLFHYTEHPPVPLHGSTVFHLHAVSGGQVSMYNSLASQIFHPFGNLYRNVQQLLLDNILKIGRSMVS